MIIMKRIMIIDDYNLQIYLLENLLNDKYEIKSINSAIGIKKKIEKYKPDLVILDIVMPNKTGLEILNEIKDLTKVFIVSSINSSYIKKKAIEMGAKKYIEKPINLEYFKNLIDHELRYIM